MELTTFSIPKSLKKLVVAPLGDLQWTGSTGPTAQDHLKRFIDKIGEQDGYFVGTGDYTDFLSPSNRRRLLAADLYDTARDVIWRKAQEGADELFEKFLRPTARRWLGLVEGHHFYEFEGQHTDEILAKKLKAKFLGTSAFIRIPSANFTLYVHHGLGSGRLPSAPLNLLYHVAAGLPGADVYVTGHSTKLTSCRLSRPFPVWDRPPELKHQDVWLVNAGGFCKSNVVGHSTGGRPRGDYAEQGLMTPSPLSAPIITVDLTTDHDRIRVSI